MKIQNFLNKLTFSLLTLIVISATMSVGAQIVPRATDRQIQALLNRIETKTDTFKIAVDRSLDRNMPSRNEAAISQYITEFENATDVLQQSFRARTGIRNEVNDVLTRAAVINDFMNRNRLTAAAENQWTSLRTDLNTLASYYRVTFSWNRPMPGTDPTYPPYTVSEVQVRNLLTRIENKTDVYKRRMDNALDRSVINNTNREDSISMYITDFENATDRLKERFEARQSVTADASEVLTRAAYINQFMERNRLSNAAERQWLNLRTDLNTLASYYRVSWNWNQTLPPYPTYPGPGTGIPTGGFDARLTGTYRLNVGLSDNVSAVIDRSVGVYNTNQRVNVRRNLERRLGSPEMLAIEKVGQRVSLASSLAPQVTFEADGIARTETTANGRSVTVTATANNREGLTMSYVGDRVNDYYVNFMPSASGRLTVTRRIYLENRNEQVTVSSVYDKVDDFARWTTVNTGGNQTGGVIDGSFIVPNGTRLTAVLRNPISTRATQVNDRFSMEVTSPGQYRGAIIEGRVTDVGGSGRFSGRANVSLDFDTIRLRNGQTHTFAGLIESVRAINGDSVSVNNEGTVRDSNQTTRTITRAGIGAVIGAIVGAIAGGGEGAAIGAGIGAGAGASTVLIQGRDNIELGQGSEFVIMATAPANIGYNR